MIPFLIINYTPLAKLLTLAIDKYFSDNMKLTRARQFSHDSPTDIRTYTDVDE